MSPRYARKTTSGHEGDGWKYMPGQPRKCAECGQTVKLSESYCVTFPNPLTWHTACRIAARRRERIRV